jgi:hypothetical protein
MSDINFLREIEEDLRRERLIKIWERYSFLIVGAAILLVVAVGSWRGWQWYQLRQSAKDGARYEQALALAASGKHAEAEKEFTEITKDATTGYRLLSRFRLAGETGKRDVTAGVAAFDAIAADSSVNSTLRDLARVRAALLLVDTASVAEITTRVQPLIGPSATFRNSAKEILALAHFRAGDRKEAAKLYTEILADPMAPSSLKNRAQVMQALTAEGSAAAPSAPTQ